MSQVPTFLSIGHITRDLHTDGSYSLGGTVTFAALTAYQLGLVSGIITCADPQLIATLSDHLPHILVQARPTPTTTTFKNIYTSTGFRTQYLHARSADILPADVPPTWRDASVVLLGPLAQELSPDLISLFPHRSGRIVAATPQGWLRRWDNDGRVWPTPWSAAEQVLPLLDVLILSHDDLLPFADGNRQEADAILSRWSMSVPLLVATDGRHGATLFKHGTTQRFPAFPVHEVDPTGAGDVFAAAFLTHLHQHGKPEEAIPFANCVASFSIEQPGIKGIPTPDMVYQRIRSSSH